MENYESHIARVLEKLGHEGIVQSLPAICESDYEISDRLPEQIGIDVHAHYTRASTGYPDELAERIASLSREEAEALLEACKFYKSHAANINAAMDPWWESGFQSKIA